MLSCSGLPAAAVNAATVFDSGVEMIGVPVIAVVAFVIFVVAVRRVVS